MTDTKRPVTFHESGDNGIHFKLPVFEGPLDLLLHLIKENKIDIYDIPIAIITRQYLDYLELMKELNLEIAGEFLVMAATLIHIKSRMLLPREEPEEVIEDPRRELVERLLEYQRFKDVAKTLRLREEVWRDVFHKQPPEKEEIEGEIDTLIEANVFDLISAFKSLMEKKIPHEVIKITRQSLTVADKINLIMERLEGEDSIRFEDLFQGDYDRASLIVTFIALLEIMRLGLAMAYQERRFGPIWIINPRGARMPSMDVIYEVIQRSRSIEDQSY